jgi:hypothetical protein
MRSERVESIKMITYFKKRYQNTFNDEDAEQNNKFFTKKLNYMFRYQKDNLLEVVSFYFEGFKLNEFFFIRIIIRKAQKNYSIAGFEGVYSDESNEGFDLARINENQPVVDQLQKEVCNYLESTSEERLRVILGWKIDILKKTII